MQAQEALVFHVTGRRAKAPPAGGSAGSTADAASLLAIDGLMLRPALLAPYRDLNAVRHDFPVVLVQGDGPEVVQSLSSLVDAVLGSVAPRGIEGERLRRQVLQLEREIRTAVAHGATGTLAEHWQAAAGRVAARAERGEQAVLEQVLSRAGSALPAQGEVLGCSAEMPARLLAHTWQAAQREKARRFHAEVAPLVQKLSDILRAAFSHSQAGCQPASLKAALGGAHRDAFDFETLSRIVGKGVPQHELPAARQQRLQQTLRLLESQRFFAPPSAAAGGEPGQAYAFAFDNCAAAAQAFAQRLPAALALVKALLVAQLEVQGRYVEAEHDLYFDALDEHALTADDLARLPDYLVCIPPGQNDAPDNAMLMDMLSAGLPVKVLVQTNDLLEDATIGVGHYAFGVRSARLATTAMGLGGMFVLQSTSSHLVALRARIARGLAVAGPALFSVYAGPATHAAALPPYLMAAAAMQSRAFPAFTYDASAGTTWATRFSLEDNPQPGQDWPVETLQYADVALQRVREPCAFTCADFLLCDDRYASHFAVLPRPHWNAAMLPVADWLALDDQEAAQRVPYLWAADAGDSLHRVIVDARLMQATRRCLLLWRRLQEHAATAGAPAGAAQAATAEPAVPAPAQSGPELGPAPETATPGRPSEEAWIETARCPSCNECQLINDRMFKYNDRKQAYIADITAGTYRQLVEAAEGCQVAIIHPGMPRDPNEPGLEDLLRRAEPFR